MPNEEQKIDGTNYQIKTLSFIVNNLENINLLPIGQFSEKSGGSVFYRFVKMDNARLSNKLKYASDKFYFDKDTVLKSSAELKDFKTDSSQYLEEINACDLVNSKCGEIKEGDLTLVITQAYEDNEQYFTYAFIYSKGLDHFDADLLLMFDSKGNVKRAFISQGEI